MTMLSLPLTRKMASLTPLVVRVIVGVVMVVHGWQKLMGGPVGFGLAMNTAFGVPFPVLTGWAVTLVELVGGLLLLLGLASRVTALVLTVELVLAILVVNVHVGFVTPMSGGGSGVEFPLTVIAGLLVILFTGPGPVSLDNALGIDDGWPATRSVAEPPVGTARA